MPKRGCQPGAPFNNECVDKIGSVARAQQSLFSDSQKALFVDDAFAGIDASHKIRELRIAYFECVILRIVPSIALLLMRDSARRLRSVLS
jgi:hypothetical protein